MEKNLTNKTVVGFFWISILKFGNAILQFLVLVILARLLNPTEFGLMSVALVIVSFSDIFTDLGFGPAITQKKELSKSDVNISFSVSFFLGLLLMALLFFLSPYISIFFSNNDLTPILRAISIVLFLHSLSSTPLGLMYRDLRYKQFSLISLVSYGIGYGCVGIILAFKGFGVWALVIGVVCQAIISTALLLVYANHTFRFEWNKKSFKGLLKFGGGYSLGKIFSFVGNKGEKIVVGRVLGLELLGIYEKGYQLVKYISGLFGETIDKVLFSPLAQKQDDRKKIAEIFIELTYLISLILFPVNSFILCNSEELVKIMLGFQWMNAVPIVKIMSFCLFFLVCAHVGSTLAKSLGDVYNRALRTFIYSLLVIVGAYFGSKNGIEGVAFMVTIAVVINYILAFNQTYNLTKVKIASFIEAHLLGLFSGFLFYFLSKNILLFNDNYILKFILNIGILLLVYLIAFIMDYKRIIKKYLKMILKGFRAK